jgi:hypothetical protein
MKKTDLLVLISIFLPAIAPLQAQCVKVSTTTISPTGNGQTIRDRYIKITATNSKGILVNGFSNISIKHCKIEYVIGSYGIQFINAPNLNIDSCEIILMNPPTGAVPLPGTPAVVQNSNCIDGYNSLSPIIKHVKMTNGSAGIFLQNCDYATIQYATGFNFRGPMPRGQFIQFNQCRGGSISDFYNYNSLTGSYPEDNINFYQSGGQTVSNGILDGNNSPTGQGIIWEQQNATYGYGGSVTNVDLLNMGNGACAGESAKNLSFTNVYVREGHCDGKGGRAIPTSGGLEFWGGKLTSISQNLQLTNCKILKTTTTPIQPCYNNTHYQPTQTGEPITVWTKRELTLVTSNPNRTIYQNNFTWTICLAKEDAAVNEVQTTIYPNPASSTIRFSGLNDDAYQLIVKDVQGVEKWQQSIQANREISIGHLAAGIYFIELVQQGERICLKKLIKVNE